MRDLGVSMIDRIARCTGKQQYAHEGVQAGALVPQRTSTPTDPYAMTDKYAKTLPMSTHVAGELQEALSEIWSEALRIPREKIGVSDNFFALGGDSLLVGQLVDRVNARFFADVPEQSLSLGDFFACSTFRDLARRIAQCIDEGASVPAAVSAPPTPVCAGAIPIAIVGMSGRFPGAPDVATLWHNVRAGIESIRTYSDEELRQAGVTPAELARSSYVKRGAQLAGVDLFDAGYFGLTPREASVLCPQQRLLLECAVDALDHAGHGAHRRDERIGVFVGTSRSEYLARQIDGRPGFAQSMEGIAVLVANSSPATRISYLLDLTGPSFNVDCACSSSLVAVHQACIALRNGECDMALAGGATVRQFTPQGYQYEVGGIVSPDGTCRPFDRDALGTVFADGAGLVVLKRLDDARSDHDTVYAVISGSAVNNDGNSKVGYVAPSAEGQVRVIKQAHAAARVAPSSIQYVETHGTGTALGDPIEILALTEAFSGGTQVRASCALGALKANIGHTEAASGIAALIKTAMALRHRELPPTLHFKVPNAAIDFDATPFYVNTALREWSTDGAVRRAAVSSFGIGGTNAHVVVEEGPAPLGTTGRRRAHLLPISAKCAGALRAACDRLATYLCGARDTSLADVAYTLQVGRAMHAWRGFVVCSDATQAAAALTQPATRPSPSRASDEPTVVFMFPGTGPKSTTASVEAYAFEPVFRETVTQCLQCLTPQLESSVRHELLGAREGREPQRSSGFEAGSRADIAEPATFIACYSMARQWQSWGIVPTLMIGHGVGEYVAACLSGTLSLQDALALAVARGRVLHRAPCATALAVTAARETVVQLIEPSCSIREVNGPRHCIVSGPPDAIDKLSQRLEASGGAVEWIGAQWPDVTALDEERREFGETLRTLTFQQPGIPCVSGMTGSLLTGGEHRTADYWMSQLLSPVEFAAGIETLMQGSSKLFLEVGAAAALSPFVQEMIAGREHTVIAAPDHPETEGGSEAALLEVVGRIWEAGAQIDWQAFNRDNVCHRVALPSYPYQRQRHWIEPAHSSQGTRADMCAVGTAAANSDVVQIATPRTGSPEHVLADVWRELLGLERVDLRDDFFELGGNSMLAVELSAKLHLRLGRPLPLRELVENSTLEQLAQWYTVA